jgi:Flp pilus assembly protein TadG
MNTPDKFRRRDDRGVVAIEFVLVAPVLVALIFAIACFGSWFSKDVQVTGDARNVARAMALEGPSWTAALPTGPGNPATLPSGATIKPGSTTTCAAGDSTDNASVTLTLPGSSIKWFSVMGVPPSPHDINATAVFRCGG